MANYLIVGGTSGIGLEITNRLVKQGHHVTVVSRSTSNDIPDDAKHVQHDVMADDLDDTITEELDGLVYCPGSINLKPFGSLKDEDFLEDYRINVLGAVKVIRAMEKKLKKSNQGSIVLFSTVAVAQGMPFHTSTASAKAAVEGLGKSLAAEYAPKIRVNVIAPSITDTPLAKNLLSSEEKKENSAKRHPLKTIGQPGDIASAAIYLLSEEASWVTGQVLGIDGGMSSLRSLQ